MANEILAENIAFDENGLYIPQTWLDGVGEGNFTPLTADRMNHIEQGIKGLSDAWDSQSPEIERHILSDCVSFYKASGLVFISFDGINCDTPEWKVIGTLPEGYRPLFNAYFPLWSNAYKTTSYINHSAHVNVNGEVSIQSNNEAIAGYGLICFPHA